MTPIERARWHEHVALSEPWRQSSQRARHLIEAYQTYSSDPKSYALRSALATAMPVSAGIAVTTALAHKSLIKSDKALANRAADELARAKDFFSKPATYKKLVSDVSAQLPDDHLKQLHHVVRKANRIAVRPQLTAVQLAKEMKQSGQSMSNIKNELARKYEEAVKSISSNVRRSAFSAKTRDLVSRLIGKKLPHRLGLVLGGGLIAGMLGAKSSLNRLRQRAELTPEEAEQFLAKRDLSRVMAKTKPPIARYARKSLISLIGPELLEA